MAGPDVVLPGDVVELQPAVLAAHDALGPEDLAVLAGVQLLQNVLNALGGEGLGRLYAPGGEDLVSVVMVMVMAGAGGIIARIPIVVVMMVVRMLLMLMVMVMLVPVIVGMVMVMAGTVGIIALASLVIVRLMVFVLFLPVVMVMMVLGLPGLVLGAHPGQQLIGQGHLFNGPEDGLAIQFVPGGGEDGGVGVRLPQQGHRVPRLHTGVEQQRQLSAQRRRLCP